MRNAVLVVLLCMLGCDARNGTYLAVDGTVNRIEFDRVEFFFGAPLGTSAPFTPKRPLQQVTASADKVAKRRYAVTDNQTALERGLSLTYYLEPDPDNAEPTYVLVLAYLGDVAVGVAEIDGLELRDDGRYVYDLALSHVATEDVERWGSVGTDVTDCVRWTRVRDQGHAPSTYAVVRGTDRDCDDSPETADCDDLNYCDPSSAVPCVGRDTCISDSCDVGRCVSGNPANGNRKSCSQDLCFPQEFCTNSSGSCDSKGDLASFEECATDHSDEHLEVFLPVGRVMPGVGALCANPYVFSLELPTGCLDPVLETPPMGMTGEFQFVVDPLDGMSCTIKILAAEQTAVLPNSAIHLLISVRTAQSPLKRETVVLGINPENIATTDCGPLATARVELPSMAGQGVGRCD